jgi:hypothetical protein
MPAVPGLGNSMARVGGDGRFSFNNVTPGDYSLQARATVREASPQGEAGRGRGRGQGAIAQVLWAAADVSVGGQPLPEIVLNLQPGMTVGGRVQFDGGNAPPDDLSMVRVSLAGRGPQTFEIGGTPPTQADATGRFTIPGVAPGRYSITATLTGGGRGGRGQPNLATPGGTSWTLASAMYEGTDLLDFPIEIGPNQSLRDVVLTYTARTQELSGTIQDTSGRPTADFTIVVFPTDTRFWLPQSRRISATRPGTDGRFTFRGLPPGSYRLTAITDVEPGEWFDPDFLAQLASVSIPISLSEGESKVQDIRLAGG